MKNPPTTKEAYKAELIRRSSKGLFPCVNETKLSCLYRGENGRECAAGILIPDKDYHPDLEYKTAYNPIIMEVIKLPSGVTYDQVAQCQNAHV